ncbi:hypothetical protein H112_07607 [Trichophyton rubrum D6]|uniref:Uncharacterized protein n=3 Tax=Trichophyton TaxID=5550 RepID=F2SEI3_TRIRC|nr:uncharacterized protein TERG_00208 [Trichophyton rubrum CBS 118892]EZF11319.1 hypothetical protein H100_07634 [Trichophyton rubrum MR850]EZF38246.1 hypothetical protein H102_07598 [Trichophyton rubrum CBS 100081]EZF48798.1 hypothetical protein H103_07620 [Trichophyton rubrum CBS 288.86]EZF59387.1 hypothetical protein H104_07569 [Trichophyton rubrum CBS 289.86]EZF70101.1 hypothetical protein H105_07624 [Trichophyton soudanense CBS 452.61]EZF80720.1 hypothetical protein H110_07617 [Trichophy
MWLRFLEVWLTARLLASPTFHRAVQRIHKSVQELRYGKAPEDMGGTNIDGPGLGKYFEYFREELRNQLGRKPPRS